MTCYDSDNNIPSYLGINELSSLQIRFVNSNFIFSVKQVAHLIKQLEE